VVKMEYTVRLNNVGDFALPPSRVEAMYAPEMFGETPNARVKVEAAKQPLRKGEHRGPRYQHRRARRSART